EPDDEENEYEEQELKKEKSTEADDNDNETENNEVRSIKSKTNQEGKKKMKKEELNMGGFGRLRVKEAYRYVKKERLTKGKIREMKNSPAKDHGDILRHVYTPKVDLEDNVFGDVEGSNKMEAIK
ncbi:hypothetical protein Tco_0916425, partial [Tanacetum coccineum]